jgi:hypothetical protein
LKDFAGFGEFLAAQACQLVVVFGVSTMAGGLAGGQADHAGFDSAIVVEPEGASEAS